MASIIISGISFGICAILFLGIGIFQYKSKSPVGFYSGEIPPKAEELTDVSAWNKKHGMMWIIYSGIVIISWIVSCFIGDSIWILVPIFGGLLIPGVFMIMYHNRLRKTYLKAKIGNSINNILIII